MEHTKGLDDPVETIRRRVKELRGRKGWSAGELGERMTGQGVAWDRSIVANLENGRRRTVSVVELLALSRVLDVAPVNLLIPLGDEPYQVTPTETRSAADARSWVRGEEPLPGTDVRMFRTEAPEAEWGGRLVMNKPAAAAERRVGEWARSLLERLPERERREAEQRIEELPDGSIRVRGGQSDG